MKYAVLIFVRPPELGKVKTRLAATIGHHEALRVYMFLLRHTMEIVKDLHADIFVFYAGDIQDNDMWSNEGFIKKTQAGESLGDRMFNAFTEVFTAGYNKALIIGSDCYDLRPNHIELAMKQLETKEVVIGPAVDGGYYLLGMCAPCKHLFQGIKWSTESVFSDTLHLIKRAQYPYYLLPVLRDVDTEEDINFVY